MKRLHLSNKEIKELNQQIQESYHLENFLDKKARVELLEAEFKLVLVDGLVSFFYHQDKLMPTLKLLLKNNFLPKVTIDMPAIKFITNGADIMRPGIKSVESFQKDQIIVIIDETHQKPLAVGQALFSSEEIQAMTSGKVIKNLHYVGDKVWNIQ